MHYVQKRANDRYMGGFRFISTTPRNVKDEIIREARSREVLLNFMVLDKKIYTATLDEDILLDVKGTLERLEKKYS